MPVYFLGEAENNCSPIKIGMTRGNIELRKRNLQTGNPLKLLLLGWIETPEAIQLEKQIHKRFEATRGRGEWFDLVPSDILPVLMEAGRDGFVAKADDYSAFQIVGYDSDAIPEYLGVWDWADLETEQCCPFCGCLCGMHFQEATLMWYCVGCDTQTNFSEFEHHGAETGH